MTVSANDFKGLITYLEDKWYSIPGLILSIIIYSVTYGLVIDIFIDDKRIKIILFITLLILLFISWAYTNFHIPRKKKNKIGFLLSIICESKESHLKVKQDFIDTLHRQIESSVVGNKFQFIELPQHQAKKIITPDDAVKLRIKSKCHYILYGRIRERVIDDKEHYFLELNGNVIHEPVKKDVSEAFGKEFGELLPNRIIIPKYNDLYSFEFASEWMVIVSKYIISVAAFISGYLDFSLEVFRDIDKYLSVKNRITEFKGIAKIKERVPEFIGANYLTRAELNYISWEIKKNNPELLDSLEHNLGQIPENYKDKINFHTLQSLVFFIKYRDVHGATESLKKIKNKDYLWYFNSAFLYAYDGNLKKALQLYKKAFLLSLVPEKAIEIEEFIYWVLENEPSKYQLYYILGFLNWKVKEDLVQAKENFIKFLGNKKNKEFDKEADLTGLWLDEIKNQIES